MNQRALIVMLVFVSCFPALARSRKAVPLLPPPLSSSYVAWSAPSSRRNASTESLRVRSEVEAPASSGRSMSLGLELGTVGRNANAQSDVFGLQLLYGGRAFLRLPLSRHFYLRPGLGYFRKSEGTAQAGVVQNAFELGSALHYVFDPAKRLRSVLGVAGRFEALFSQISAFDSSGTSPLAYRFRLGPTAGLAYSIDRDISLTSDLETGFSFTKPVRFYAGLTFGFFFRLD